MATDMNVDIGAVFKKLFSRKGLGGKSGGDKQPSDPFVKVIIIGASVLVIVILYLFFVHFPAQEENRIKEEKIAKISDMKSCIAELDNNIIRATKDLSIAQAKYNKLTNLFHSGQELDDLYRHISMLALTNQLMVSKIKKSAESPIFEIEQSQNNNDVMDAPPSIMPISDANGADSLNGLLSACDNIQSSDQMSMDGNMINEQNLQDSMLIEGMSDEGESKPQKVAYYELKVEFEISGNYTNYTNFRKGLAKLKKIVNINQEKIVVLQSETKKGEVKVETILAIYRLPTNDSEKYIVTGEQQEGVIQ
jgi:Tfp pilus assembly protein PilO